jgi:hypothetical protein
MLCARAEVMQAVTVTPWPQKILRSSLLLVDAAVIQLLPSPSIGER